MNKLVLDRSQELVFALIKLSGYIRRKELRERIENNSYSLIESIYSREIEASLSFISRILALISLSKNLYEIEIKNASILIDSFRDLENEIRSESGEFNTVDIKRLISTPVRIKKENKKGKSDLIPESYNSGINIPDEILIETPEFEADPESFDDPEDEISADERRERINSMLEERKRLQLRDFIAVFPEVSERTLRYDLKRLFEQGKIERQGSGGPSSYYLHKES